MGTLKKKVIWSDLKGYLSYKRDDCIILNKCIYSLAQAARQSYKKADEMSGLTGGNVDLFLYVKKIEKGIVYVALYVDNNLMIGHIKVTKKVIAALKENGLVMKSVEGLKDYLSC